MTSVMFVNHASILLKNEGKFMLTDPWFQKPAFGSWLPTFPQYCHPAYLAALRENLAILVSHGHDDHCDDDLLRIFDKSTPILLADFDAPSVVNRLKRLGFSNLKTVGRDGTQVGNFFVKSYVQPTRSDDDAIFTISSRDAFVIHCNDNWFRFDADVQEAIRTDAARYSQENILFLSQTNSASGYPLNYDQFSPAEKAEILRRKVTDMIEQSLKNAQSVGARAMVAYAGYASVFVRDRPEYEHTTLFPTPRFIKNALAIDNADNILDFYPGDVIDLNTGKITKAFVGSDDYTDDAIKKSTHDYYRAYQAIDACDTFDDGVQDAFSTEMLDYFLTNFDEFVTRKSASDSFFGTAIGKAFAIEVTDLGITRQVKLGSGLCAAVGAPNKKLKCPSGILNKVLRGQILFENLYTGYEGTFERNPRDTYNRDIVMFMVMYSYVYKNRLAQKFKVDPDGNAR